MTDRGRDARDGASGVSIRGVAGVVIALLTVLFVALNRDSTEVSFIAFSTETKLWVALTVAALLGVAVGFLLGRRFYRD